MQLRKPATAILALALSAGLAQADDAAPAAGSTLDKIAKNGVIVVGHRESSVPFSYYDNQQKVVGYSQDYSNAIDDNQQKVVGYSQDYSNAIVEAVKKKLNKPDLQVKLIPITSQNRIPLLQNGTFDFECGSTTNNAERQKQAAFSDTIFVVGTRLLTKKGGDIKDFADLKGKAVVVTSGTTSEVLLNKLNEEQKMNMRIISAKDHGDSFRTLESGRAVAFMMDDALLAGERAKAKKPDNWEIVGKPQSQEAYGCMLRKDDPQFKKLMDDTIAQVQTSGEAEKWFDKWFKNPIPPKNLNMNFELSDEMKALFKEPNDKALN
ncbi:amino acid ABC transporter substrate-binding protein [Escherichia coli]|nr:amino acid ABC transporter substrate-binding protein [Escherichia coli]EJS0489328.1 amino acid ABC transporter substrate-binding protein [Escherichia coli]